MKIQVEFHDGSFPPLIRLFIHHAPHKRSHPTVIAQYRAAMRKAFAKAGIPTPIAHPIDLEVTFIDPTSPDLDHLHEGIYLAELHEAMNMAMDHGVLEDDGYVDKVKFKGDGKTRGDTTLRRMYVHDPMRLGQS